MCCRVDVDNYPDDPTLSQIMKIGGFIELGGSDYVRNFIREFSDRRTIAVEFWNRAPMREVKFKLAPTIGHHTYEDHFRNRDMGAVMMKMAQTLAECSNAKIVQRALLGDCETDEGFLVLADYPETPLLFEHLCYGFRTILGQGVAQDAPQTEAVAD